MDKPIATNHQIGPAVSHGGATFRGLDNVPRSRLREGRFGRMFRHLLPFRANQESLQLLAKTMIEKDEDVDGDPFDNRAIPSGFTYLGQFIDHDLTFDPNSKLQKDNDPDALRNFRTPRFDLDSLYADGPDNNPFMYDGEKFLIGKAEDGTDDLPRGEQKDSQGHQRALIGDPRNDENFIVSQLHLQFLKFHNKVYDQVGNFDETRRIVRWHYQWIVINDFLRRIVGENILHDVLRQENFVIGVGDLPDDGQGRRWKADLKFFDWKNDPFMPVEFSVAAYRFGHSMVRFDYALNEPTDGHELEVFSDDPEKDLRGFRKRLGQREIQWFRFFETGGAPGKLQNARDIDTLLSAGLSMLPDTVVSDPDQLFHQLAFRNLMRGVALGLPSGQMVARAMGIPAELILGSQNRNPDLKLFEADEIDRKKEGKAKPWKEPPPPQELAVLKKAFGEDTPLWYYILREAEFLCNGKKLGPVGGRIVAEVFIGLLIDDKSSYLNMMPGWEPEERFGATPGAAKNEDKFNMALLLNFVRGGPRQ
jgi:hypothetical protein